MFQVQAELYNHTPMNIWIDIDIIHWFVPMSLVYDPHRFILFRLIWCKQTILKTPEPILIKLYDVIWDLKASMMQSLPM